MFTWKKIYKQNLPHHCPLSPNIFYRTVQEIHLDQVLYGVHRVNNFSNFIFFWHFSDTLIFFLCYWLLWLDKILRYCVWISYTENVFKLSCEKWNNLFRLFSPVPLLRSNGIYSFFSLFYSVWLYGRIWYFYIHLLFRICENVVTNTPLHYLKAHYACWSAPVPTSFQFSNNGLTGFEEACSS